MITAPSQVDADEFKAMADDTWDQLIGVKRTLPLHVLRQKRQGGYELPKAYPLHNTYAKGDAYVHGPTCGSSEMQIQYLSLKTIISKMKKDLFGNF